MDDWWLSGWSLIGEALEIRARTSAVTRFSAWSTLLMPSMVNANEATVMRKDATVSEMELLHTATTHMPAGVCKCGVRPLGLTEECRP